MSEVSKFFQRALDDRLAELHTAMPCKVISFDETECTADVQPLFMIKYVDDDVAQPRPILIDVPVMKRKTKTGGTVTVDTPFYEPGDIVLIVFLERAYDNVKSGEIADPHYNRKHALDDGIIIGLLG